MSHNTRYPEGSAVKEQIAGRHRRGTTWQILFQVSTIIGIIALIALLYNITNQAFGIVAVQNKVEPDSLVLAVEEARLLSAENIITSEDDTALAAGIANDANSIGFFGYAYYQENSDLLKLLAVDGVQPTAESVANGEYALIRPLYLYTTADILAQNQAANIFLNYYLTYVNEEIESVGYFPADDASLNEARAAWVSASGFALQPGQWANINPDGIAGSLRIVGSSTLLPLNQRMAEQITAAGFAANVNLQTVGSTAGLQAFCEAGTADIAAASRKITPAEYEACRENGRRPIEIRVGTDALTIVTSSSNSFVEDISLEQLSELFTTATSWSDVDARWPETAVARYIPGADSGTLDFFTQTVFPIDLADMPKETLVDILAANISVGLGRRLEREQRFFDDSFVFEDPALFAEVCASEEPAEGCTLPARDQSNVYDLIVQEVVAPDVVAAYSLVDSLFARSAIEAEAAEKYPNAELSFRSWLTADFLVSPQSSTPEFAGVRTAVLGSLWVVGITILFSFPIGVGAAIYLEEYAADNRLNRIIQTNINNLAGVPSIIYGMLGLAIFVRSLEPFTSGAMFGIGDGTTANGRTILSAGLTLGLLILPVIIIASQEAIRAVPNSLRQAGMALGATKWQTIWAHVLPSALPGILTGTILAVSRAIGETAPLVVVGASTLIFVDPDGPFSKFTTLPIQIYQWTARPQAEFRNIAAAAILVLLIMLISLNASAILLRNRYARRA
ncbi:MAG: phosphate ABC transporter permease PstA [Ardenticatenaceae bacterium]|nr:phosphate ABC transporter permease PstA [Anaerolineales bacterium]MCB8941063.1 phosphate ABC transporter permease PstA [Ardenticatenaceae bacterium]MCB8972404.1 phosphate ABC transporter permease PstA [Ardenticatenaceae bacterium]